MPEDLDYQGYCLVIAQEPPRWFVGIFARRSTQRRLHWRQEVTTAETREWAVAEAKRRVDRLLEA